MAAIVRFVKPEHEEIIRDYLQDEGIILVMPNMKDEYQKRNINDGDMIDYDYGGEADKFVDIVSNNQHYSLEVNDG